MINLDKCNGICNAVNDLFTKIYVPSKTKDINVEVFNMITKKNEVKMLVKHISFDCKCEFNSKTCNSNQKWNNVNCQCDCKKYHKYNKDYSWNPSTCICQNEKYLKNITDTSVIVCNVFVNVMDVTNVTNTIPTNDINIISTNVTSTVSTNIQINKVRYKMNCYILPTVLLVIISLFIIAIICYH